MAAVQRVKPKSLILLIDEYDVPRTTTVMKYDVMKGYAALKDNQYPGSRLLRVSEDCKREHLYWNK